jgi:thymidylate synthase
MKQYHEVLQKILDEGFDSGDRTGTGKRSVFATQQRFNLQEGFPLVTTRKIYTKTVIMELLWFIKGSTNTKELSDQGVKIWDNWTLTEEALDKIADKYSENNDKNKSIFLEIFKDKINTIGPMYGNVWRYSPMDRINMLWPDVNIEDIASDKLALYESEYEKFKAEHNPTKGELPCFNTFLFHHYYSHKDQLQELIVGLKNNPNSRRHIVTAWLPNLVPFENLSPEENIVMDKGALAACHMMFQCFVSPPKEEGGKKRLSLQIYIRSNDCPIGAPYNIAQYALLTHMLAQVTDMEPHELIWTTGDAHIYLNQIDGVKTQLTRTPLPLPKLWLNPDIKDIYKFTYNDIKILNYQHHEDIKYQISK